MPYDPIYSNIWQSYDPTGWNYEPQFSSFNFDSFKDGIPVFTNEGAVNPKTGRMEYTANMSGKTYYYKDKNGKLTLRSDAPSDGWSASGLLRTLGSLATGGLSDLPFAIQNAIKNSTTRDWQKLLTGGTSEVVRGYQNGKPLQGWVNFFGGLVNNPLINTFDDWFTSIGTTPQRLLRDTGLMTENVYGKNYKYTKDLAHAIGLLFAGGASSALGEAPILGGSEAGLSPALAAKVTAADLAETYPALGATGANVLAQAGQIASNPFAQKLASLGLKQAGKIAAAELLNPTVASSGVLSSPYIENSNAPYTVGGLLNTSTPELLNRSSIKSQTPSYQPTELPKLGSYGDEDKQKLTELLTNKYKNYTLSDYALYKADPEQLRRFLDAQYVA